MQSIAKVVYRNDSCVAEILGDFGDYYYRQIPKYISKNRQKYPCHITIVRVFEQVEFDGYKDGELVTFTYSPIVKEDDKYFFLECWCDDINDIRTHYGLRPFRMYDCHHITVGNKK